jgi:hypothetical protein
MHWKAALKIISLLFISPLGKFWNLVQAKSYLLPSPGVFELFVFFLFLNEFLVCLKFHLDLLLQQLGPFVLYFSFSFSFSISIFVWVFGSSCQWHCFYCDHPLKLHLSLGKHQSFECLHRLYFPDLPRYLNQTCNLV